jgi:hypothetical protein
MSSDRLERPFLSFLLVSIALLVAEKLFLGVQSLGRTWLLAFHFFRSLSPSSVANDIPLLSVVAVVAWLSVEVV